MMRRITSLFIAVLLAVGLVSGMSVTNPSQVGAWASISISSVNCTVKGDNDVNNWTITLPQGSNYKIQWADNENFNNLTNVTMHQGANDLATSASVTTLYVRWTDDSSVNPHATWNGGSCPT